MASIKPFSLYVPEQDLNLLQQKLSLTRLPDELDEAGWHYGAPLTDVKRLVNHWRNGFNWRAQETAINASLTQFTTDIEVDGHGTLNVHFVHEKSTVEHAIPLLFVHGWPGSFVEVEKVIKPWTTGGPEHPSFHVVALSLPGFGFSQAPRKRGFVIQQYAEVCNKLMISLGYAEYVCQGGDWGYIICRELASRYGGRSVKAWHTNGPRGEPVTSAVSLDSVKNALSTYTDQEKAGLKRLDWFENWGRGYARVQSTRPQTLGYTLADSPVGLLAWIYEKLVEWTDGYKWTDDEVLTWVSIYWHSAAGPAASLRIYYEAYQNGDNAPTLHVHHVPLGVSYFPQEIFPVPDSWVRPAAKVVFARRHEKGGHFAAHEVPDALVGDVRDMFRKGGPAYGVVEGKDGYNP